MCCFCSRQQKHTDLERIKNTFTLFQMSVDCEYRITLPELELWSEPNNAQLSPVVVQYLSDILIYHMDQFLL